jgi:hypothetical protein
LLLLLVLVLVMVMVVELFDATNEFSEVPRPNVSEGASLRQDIKQALSILNGAQAIGGTSFWRERRQRVYGAPLSGPSVVGGVHELRSLRQEEASQNGCRLKSVECNQRQPRVALAQQAMQRSGAIQHP